MNECDNSTREIHISNNFILSISFLFDGLLLRPSLHCNTSLHFTTLHPTTLHHTSPNYTSLHFTTLHPTTLHYTSLHFTTLHPTYIIHVKDFSLPELCLIVRSVPRSKHRLGCNQTDNVRFNVTLRRVRATIVVISITYSECVSVALIIQHAIRMLHIVICGLSVSIIFSCIIS
jgi:hypothetical protein